MVICQKESAEAREGNVFASLAVKPMFLVLESEITGKIFDRGVFVTSRMSIVRAVKIALGAVSSTILTGLSKILT